MIYLFYGTDETKARGKWRQVIAAFEKKYPTGAVFRFDAEHFNQSQFEELACGGDLFGDKRLVASDHVLENDEARQFLEQNLALVVGASTVFVFLERETESTFLNQLEAAGAKVEVCEAKARAAGSSFNPFALSDALAARDRKQLWLVYQESLRAGMSEEEIFWKLAWQVKSLLTVQNSKTPPKAMKPFVLQKSQRALKNFQPGELEQLSGELVTLWHEARRGQADFEIGLEKLVLSI
jgi:DNA polymerase III delta subunit